MSSATMIITTRKESYSVSYSYNTMKGRYNPSICTQYAQGNLQKAFEALMIAMII